MAAHAVITLDTSAPEVTWGATTGTTAGELFQIGYELDEPDATLATLTLADARQLPMAVGGSFLQVLLPPDTPSGPATVNLLVEDDLGNQAERTTVVMLIGAAGAAPIPVGPTGAPQGREAVRPPQPAEGRLLTSGSRAATSTRYRSDPEQPLLLFTAAHLQSRYEVAPGRVVRSPSSRAALPTINRVGRAQRRLETTATGRSAAVVTSRRDGPDLELLILLG